jgi:cytochrome c2
MNRKIILLAGVLSALAGLPAAMAQQDQAPLEALIAEADGAQGEQIARACRNCHSLSLGESHRIGPNLYGVTGRRVAGAAGFSYSDALVAKIGETWTDENLSGFLKSPRTWAPGTKMSFPGLPNDRERAAVIAYLRSLPDRAAGEAGPGSTAAADGQTVKIEAPQQLVREGLVIDFSVTPAPDRQDTLREGDIAEVAFRITDEATGGPVSGLFPGAWMDIAAPWGDSRKPDRSCKDRVGLYLQGNVGIRPLIDMNNYFLMSLNEDATITVIDPFVGISGITKLYGLIKLKRPGADWAKTADDKRFFVSMPRADQVAVVNTAGREISLGRQRQQGAGRERRHRDRDRHLGNGRADPDRRRTSRDRFFGRQPHRLRLEPHRRNGHRDRRPEPAKGCGHRDRRDPDIAGILAPQQGALCRRRHRGQHLGHRRPVP